MLLEMVLILTEIMTIGMKLERNPATILLDSNITTVQTHHYLLLVDVSTSMVSEEKNIKMN